MRKASNVIPIRPKAEQTPKQRRRIKVNGYKLAVVAALLYFVATFINQELVMMKLRKQLNQIDVQIEAVSVQKDKLQQRLQYFQSDTYIQDEARTRFGLGLPGEIQYVTVDGEPSEKRENR